MRHTFLNICGIIAVVASIIFAINYTKEKEMDTGIKLENMDLSINPANDFFDYATL